MLVHEYRSDGFGRCCVENAPHRRAAPPDGGIGTDFDSALCLINTSNYDQSCSLDSDCIGMFIDLDGGIGRVIPIQSGNYCTKMCVCGGGAINRTSLAQYASDVLKTPLLSGGIPGAGCFCPLEVTPCCQQGVCMMFCSASDAGQSVGQDANGLAD